jgi:GNAT superfamily N-acetyltransferase
VTAAGLAEEAEALMDGLGHRKLEVFDFALGERLAPGFAELGWHAEGLVHMIHDGPAPRPEPGVRPEPATDEQVRPIRISWVEAPHTREEVAEHMPTDEAVGRVLGARNLVLRDGDGAIIAFTRYLAIGDLAEVQNVFVHPGHRGRGLGGTLTSATIARAMAEGARRVFIVADAFGRPRELYRRLGFRDAWESYEFVSILRPPAKSDAPRT